jgi:hypothetical protein
VAEDFYVARDRARRFAFRLAQALQERSLAYRGDAVGMSSLQNEALLLLAEVEKDVETSVADVLAARVRDRERAYMDIPFTVMAESVGARTRLALTLERARTAKTVPESQVQEEVLALLAAAQRRIDAFCAAYDEKKPLASARATDLARLLHLVERDAAWERTLRPPAGPAPFDTPPPEAKSDPEALDDLLRAARAAVPADPGPWHVARGRASEPFTLALGSDAPDLVDLPAPGRLERAARVLAFLHPVEVRCRGRVPAKPARRDWGAEPAGAPPPTEPVPTFVVVRLPDPAAGGTQLAAVAGAGDAARLSPEAEKAVRALLSAPPMPAAGVVPPARTVALLGLLKAFDVELTRALLPRLSQPGLKTAALDVPREDSRKAQVRKDVLTALEAALPGFPTGRVEDVVTDVAAGKVGRKRCNPLDAVVLLLVFGRAYVVGGYKAQRALRLEPWTDDDVLAAAHDLLEVAGIRRDLEAGRGADATALTRMERAVVALLGRLGRLTA